MMSKIRQNKLLTTASIFALVGILTISYAVFTSNLNINGTGINRKSNFDIHFANLSSPTIVGTANVVTAPTIQNNNTVIEDYSITLATPKDSVSYTFDIVNDGDYDATLKGLTVGPVKCSVNGNESNQSAVNVCSNIEYTLKYADGSTIQPNNDKLLSKETKQLKLTLTYKEFNDASKLPTSNVSISNLGIELVYEADNQAKTNSDGSTPLKTYTIGEELTFKNEKYNIIGIGSDYLTLLKQKPLTVEEVNTYGGVGTENNHVNMYASRNISSSYYHQSHDWNDENHSGGMAYYSSLTCGYNGSRWIYSGCTTDYNSSEVKYVVDAWAADKFQNDELKEVDNYKARLVQKEELRSQFYPSCSENDYYCQKESTTPSWLYAPNYEYWYWTMSGDEGSSSAVWYVGSDGYFSSYTVDSYNGAVRPVINLYKSKL